MVEALSNVRRIHWLKGAAATALTIMIWSGSAFAQGFDWSQLLGGGGSPTSGGGGMGGNSGGGLSQLFGGGNGAGQGRAWNRSAPQSSPGAISVERSAPPFTGKFSGSQNDQGAQTTITAQFSCYPASDADIPQSRAFVCYTAPSGQSGPAGWPSYGGPSSLPSYGPPRAVDPRYSSSAGPPTNPPPDIE